MSDRKWNRREVFQNTAIGALGIAVGGLWFRGGAAPETAVGAMGWVDDPEGREPVAATMVPFADTPAFQAVRGDEPDHVFLWDFYRRVYGANPPERDQGAVGSCVSFGTAAAIEATLAAQVVLGFPGEFRDLAQEVIYGGSRVEIGGGRIRGDGSIGAWAAKFVVQFGVLARGIVKGYDLTQYDESRCRGWGRTGVPDDLEPEARKFPVKDAAQVKSWIEFKRALASGYGVAICSNQGFTMRRDERGVCQPKGTWYHCMGGDAFIRLPNGEEYGHLVNSWRGAHTGPVGWGNPNGAGFWADSKVIDRMLKQGDSWAFSGATGFPARQIDWNVQGAPRLRRVVAA